MKTARFAELVKKAGAPDSYLLWVPSKADKVFQRAVKEHRILTIHQENVGTKKDYGVVGFHEEPNAQYLVFPKSLKTFVDRRIVGINYDLLAKESRAGKAPELERRSPTAKAPKKGALKSATKKADTEKSGEPEEKIVAFESPVAKSASLEERSVELMSASKLSKSSKRPKNPKRSKPPKQPIPEKSASPADKPPPPEKAVTGQDAIDPRVLRVVRRAMKDLDAGKTVAAYKRLEALVAGAKKDDG